MLFRVSRLGIGIYLLATQPESFNAYILCGSGIGQQSSSFLIAVLHSRKFSQVNFLYVNTEEVPEE
ncbi:MAG: hypothetical protein HKN68_12735 [Saprospiraceae bacterium]|nr:hypothetical protein [Saprospiraceae bacterium]